jgi:hypothetical protein
MDFNKEQLNNFLKEGETWFKKYHFPETFPCFIAQIPDAINKFSESVNKQAESNKMLSESIKYATWAAVVVAFLALAWDIIKTFYLK